MLMAVKGERGQDSPPEESIATQRCKRVSEGPLRPRQLVRRPASPNGRSRIGYLPLKFTYFRAAVCPLLADKLAFVPGFQGSRC